MTTKDKKLLISMTEEMHAELEQRASQENLSMAALIRNLIVKELGGPSNYNLGVEFGRLISDEAAIEAIIENAKSLAHAREGVRYFFKKKRDTWGKMLHKQLER